MVPLFKSVLGCGSKNSGRSSKGLLTINTSHENYQTGRFPHTAIPTPEADSCPAIDLVRDSTSDHSAISRRAQSVLDTPSVTVKYNQKITEDTFHPETRPGGCVDLGLAENKLCEDLITQKFQSLPNNLDGSDTRYYPDFKGLPGFRNSLKIFLEREFDSREPLDADNIVVACGVTALLDAMASALAEEGEYMMTPSPYYYRIKNDLLERARVHVLEVPLVAKPKIRRVKPYTLDVDILEEALLIAQKEGKKVKAIILVNPNNPLGDVYSGQQLAQVLDFAARYQLHVIVDEIYAMSMFDPNVTFTSVLSLYHPDPQRVHFLWGFSKDFGLSGYRCGVLYSPNKQVINYLESLGVYQQTGPLLQQRLKHLIDDTDWLHTKYLPALRDRLRRHYLIFYDALRKCGVDIHPSSGGFFIWMDASKYLPQPTFDAEEWLFEQFMKEKVFILPGKACRSTVPGFFRIVFSLEELVCTEGIKRIQNVFRRIHPANIPNGF